MPTELYDRRVKRLIFVFPPSRLQSDDVVFYKDAQEDEAHIARWGGRWGGIMVREARDR